MKTLVCLMCLVVSIWANHFIEVSGEFVTLDRETPTEGSFSIINSDGERELQLESNFSVAEGPDLYILLSPLSLSDATNENAMNGAFVVGKLESFTGASTYAIPDSIELGKFKSILIHCVEYSHLFGGAPTESQEISVLLLRQNSQKGSMHFTGIVDLRGRVMETNISAQGVRIHRTEGKILKRLVP